MATDELRADMRIIADGSGQSSVYTWLFTHRAGDPPLNEDTIRLVNGDAISVTSSAHTISMQESLFIEYRYDATFDTAAPGQRYEIALARSADTSAPHSTVTLPEPFTPTLPAAFSRSAPLTITWSPSGSQDPVSVHFIGCSDVTLQQLADTGTVTLPAGAFTTTGAPMNPTCDLAVEVSRSRLGTLDPAFGQGGSITALQQRMATITSMP
ncbi:MAG: hypothetical protein ABJE66_06635 [Deltaproteobacteria bacterium]